MCACVHVFACACLLLFACVRVYGCNTFACMCVNVRSCRVACVRVDVYMRACVLVFLILTATVHCIWINAYNATQTHGIAEHLQDHCLILNCIVHNDCNNSRPQRSNSEYSMTY